MIRSSAAWDLVFWIRDHWALRCRLCRVYAAFQGGLGASPPSRRPKGVAPRPMLARTQKQHQNSTPKTTQKAKTQRKQMIVQTTQIGKKQQSKNTLLITSILSAILITGCQTAAANQNRQVLHVLSEQEALLESVKTERSQTKVKTQVAKSETLTKAELHLAAALNALKQSNQAIKEALKND